MKKTKQASNPFLDKLNELTPVEKHGDMWFKRDDLFKLDDSLLNGGKLRQCLSIVHSKRDHIKNECNGTIITPTTVKSPQGLIVAVVAKMFGFKCIVGVGNIKSVEHTVGKNKTMELCQNEGAEIRCLGTQGFHSVLEAQVRKLQETEPMFNISFGLRGTRDEIITPIADQVRNIPEEVNTVVIPAGSGYSTAGIIEGLIKYEKDILPIVIQPFGYDRRDNITGNIDYYSWEYDFNYYMGDYPYGKEVEYIIDETLDLDTIYESKAFDYFMKNVYVGVKDTNILFWIVANANWTRK